MIEVCMFRKCDICKCNKFRVKRIIINVIKTTMRGGFIEKEYYKEARYMCPICRRLYKKKKLTNTELFGGKELSIERIN